MRVLTKADVLAPEDRRALVAASDDDTRVISAHTGEGVPELLEQLWRLLEPPRTDDEGTETDDNDNG